MTDSITPFTLELACAFETLAATAAGPWEFWVRDCELTLAGELVVPLGWQDMERRLAVRAANGSIFEPRR